MTKSQTDERTPTISDWERLRTISDEDVERSARDDEDNPATDEAHWSNAIVTSPLTIMHLHHLDADVIDWFRSGGKDYWDRMNAALRDHMLAHRRKD